MKVLMVCGSYPPARCGIGDYTGFLSKELSRQGIDVEVLTSSYLGIKGASGRLKVSPSVDSWSVENTWKILDKAREADPDIVHIQYPNLEYKKNLSFNFLPALIKRSMPGIRVVETFHEPIRDLTIFGRLRMALNMPYADACVFVEKENYDSLPFFLKAAVKAKKKAFIPIASNIKMEKASKKARAMLLKKFGIPPGKKVLMTFGFITRTKGYESLFGIFDGSREAWVHLGQVNDREAFQRGFMEKAGRAGIRIHFTGHVESRRIAQYLLSADVCVFPFKEGVTDRHGTFLAAASQGVYIAAYHRLKEGYFREENVFYARCGDARALKRAIEFVPPVKRVKPRIPGWDEIAKAHVELYKSL